MVSTFGAKSFRAINLSGVRGFEGFRLESVGLRVSVGFLSSALGSEGFFKLAFDKQ